MNGIYYKTLFRNQETGETKFQITPKEQTPYAKDGLLTCYGKIGIYAKDMPIGLNGEYDEERDIFSVSSDYIPRSNEQDAFALLEYVASDLTECQKTEIAAFAENDIFLFVTKKEALSKLMEIFKDSPKAGRMARGIIRKVLKLKEKEEITKHLMSYGIPIDRIEALYKKEITMEDIDKSPYTIMLKFGIPIANIEIYAFRRLQIDEYDPLRLCGFLYDAMLCLAQSGHTCCELRRLVKTINMRFHYHGAYMTVVDESLVNYCVEALSDEVAYREVCGKPYVYLHHIWEEETSAKLHVNRLQANKKDFKHDVDIGEIESGLGITYNPGQRAAFHAADSSGIKILTGPPGSGKTAVIRGLMEYFKKGSGGIVKLAATTGMAAKIMSKACKDDSETANLMLNVRPYDNSVQGRNLNNPVEADMVIVDEVSMLGLQLFSILVGAVRSGSILLLVGDEDQLQSVEYGNVLHDLIQSGMVEVYRLTEILRQSGTICSNAQSINQGRHDLQMDASFAMRRYHDPQDAIEDLQKNFVKGRSQILSPMRNGPLGTFALNSIFQDSQKEFAAAYGKKIFRISDRVIMTKTNYDKGYINGDVGKIIGKNPDETVVVQFDEKRLTIERQDLRDMELADAITVHKSQGSECEGIHIVLPLEARHMMTRRILYTGVTRAKRYIRIYAVENAIEQAIDDAAERKRMTLLSQRLLES